MWTDEQIQFLINERKVNNEFYHDLVGGGKKMFWKDVASRFNLQFGTKFSGQQIKEKFQGLVRDYNVNKTFIYHSVIHCSYLLTKTDLYTFY